MGIINWQDFLKTANFSHQMTTAKAHIELLCEAVEKTSYNILEFGSYLGISTAALALAAPTSRVTSVDLCDHITNEQRMVFWKSLGISNIQAYFMSTANFLQSPYNLKDYDFIFHDAVHGSAAMPEYIECAKQTRRYLAIHDWEQLSEDNQKEIKSYFYVWTEYTDDLGRELFIGIKS